MNYQNIRQAPDNSVLVYQIDVTNWCNATCTYCPHPTHKRERGYISKDVFRETLRAMKNTEVSLHHFGEPLLHKGLEDLVAMASEHGVDVGFSSNGKGLKQARLEALVDAGLKWFRLHTDPFGVRKHDFIVPPGLEFTEHRLLVASDAPKKELVSFSGHLDIPSRHGERGGLPRCSYLEDGWRVVLWDGSFALCCHDIEGTLSKSLCNSCDGYVFDSPRVWGDYDGVGDTSLRVLQ